MEKKVERLYHMEYEILLTKQQTNGYLARPVLMPELVVSGADEAEALARVRTAIAEATAQSRIVRVNVPSDSELEDKIRVSRTDKAAKLQLMEQAITDPRFLADLNETMKDFAHIDAEWWKPHE